MSTNTPLVTRQGQRFFDPIQPVLTRPAPAPRASTTPPQRTGLRPDIEGMRAISILLVVLYHAGMPYLPGGYVGVDVFFVISGFLITSHLVREIDTDRISLARFYTRRALRLLPAATLVIASTLAATWYWAPITRLKGVSWDSIAANLYFINYRLATLGTDYRTASAPPSPLQHFWSLAVEEQFYLVIPLLLIGIGFLRRHSAFVVVLAAITAGSLYWSIVFTRTDPTWAYFSTTSRAWELGAGALLAVSVGIADRLPHGLLVLLRWAGVAGIGYAAATFTDKTPFPSYWAGIPVLAAMAIIAGGQRHPDDPILGNQLFGWIGARSYSWYLWHWPILTLAPFILGHTLNLPYRLGALALALGFAWFTYEVFEHPVRQNRDLRTNPRAALKFTGGLTAAVLVLAVLLPHAPPRQRIGLGTVAELSLHGTGSVRQKALTAQIETSSKLNALPVNLTPTLTDAPLAWPEVYADSCHLNFQESESPRRCERFGDKQSKTVVALFGDSHAAQWFPTMAKIAKKKHWRLINFTKAACSPADVTIYLPQSAAHGEGPYDECNTWRATTLRRLQAIKPNLIVIGSRWSEYAVGVSGSEDQVNDAFKAAYTRTAQTLLTIKKTKIAYINDSPWMKSAVPDCLAIHPNNIQECGRTFKSATDGKRRVAIASAFHDLHIKLIDSMPWFCSLQYCPPVIGDHLVYTDTSHITPPYAEFLAPMLAEALPRITKNRVTKVRARRDSNPRPHDS